MFFEWRTNPKLRGAFGTALIHEALDKRHYPLP